MERTGLRAAVVVATKLALVLFALAGLYHAVLFLLSYYAESRPPIIVKGGSIHFESVDDPKNGHVHKKKWKKIGNNVFLPDHPSGRAVHDYEVVATDASNNETNCGKAPSVSAIYTDGDERTPFLFLIVLDDNGKLAPMLITPVGLQANGDYELDYGQATKGAIALYVGTQPCAPGATKFTLWPK